MSVAMIASFMPSLAFAAGHTYLQYGAGKDYTIIAKGEAVTTETDSAKKDDAQAKVDKYVKVIKAPTHTEKGQVELTCTEPLCSEVEKAELSELGHKAANDCSQRDLSLEAYASAILAQKGFDNKYAADNWVKTQKAAKGCYVKNVAVCSCGYVYPIGTKATVDSIEKTFGEVATHDNATCEDVVCKECGTTLKGVGHKAGDINKNTDKKVSDPTCEHGTGYEKTCTVCGKKFTKYDDTDRAPHTFGSAVSGMTFTETGDKTGYWTGEAVKTVAGTGLAATSTLKEGYIAVVGTTVEADLTKAITNPNAKFYKYSEVKGGTDCTTGAKYVWNCAKCGKKITDATKTSAHDWEKTHVAATCDHAGYNTYVCKTCGVKGSAADKPDETIATEPQLAHNYKVTKVPATCDTAEYYIVECTTCDKKVCSHGHDDAETAGKRVFKNDASGAGITDVTPATADATKTKTIAWTGFDNELKGTKVIEMTFDLTARAGHKFGKKELLKAATCEDNEIWGYKCSECGKIGTHVDGVHAPDVKVNSALGHDHPVVKVEATCVNKAYEAKSEECTRCGKTDEAIVEANKAAAEKAAINGGKHAFDKWVVVKDSTVFEEGVKQLKCSKCGAMDATKTVIAKKTVGKPVVKLVSKKGKLTVKASAVDNATGYEVTYKRAGKKATTKTYTAESISKTYRLLKGKKYTVTVTAFASNGTDTVKGATVTKTITIKK